MLRQRLGHGVLALLVLTAATPASASLSQPGHVGNLIVNDAGRFFFDQDGGRDARPACAIHNRWVIDATISKGQAMMALLLTAQAQGKRVVVFDSNDCKDWSDTEAINVLQVVN